MLLKKWKDRVSSPKRNVLSISKSFCINGTIRKLWKKLIITKVIFLKQIKTFFTPLKHKLTETYCNTMLHNIKHFVQFRFNLFGDFKGASIFVRHSWKKEFSIITFGKMILNKLALLKNKHNFELTNYIKSCRSIFLLQEA